MSVGSTHKPAWLYANAMQVLNYIRASPFVEFDTLLDDILIGHLTCCCTNRDRSMVSSVVHVLSSFVVSSNHTGKL
jgi:hypothetical protein